MLQWEKEECLSEEELSLQSNYDFPWMLLSYSGTYIILLIAIAVVIQPSKAESLLAINTKGRKETRKIKLRLV